MVSQAKTLDGIYWACLDWNAFETHIPKDAGVTVENLLLVYHTRCKMVLMLHLYKIYKIL